MRLLHLKLEALVIQDNMLAYVMRDLPRHMDLESLERFSMGQSSPEETVLIEEHILICESCQERLRETDEFVQAIRMASVQVRRDERFAPPEPRWSFPRWLPAFAAAACALLMVVFALRFVPSSTPAMAVSLTALKGSGPGSTAPAGRELMIQPDLKGLAQSTAYRLEIVDLNNHAVRKGTLVLPETALRVPGLPSGLYFVRVYLPKGDLLREYGLQIH